MVFLAVKIPGKLPVTIIGKEQDKQAKNKTQVQNKTYKVGPKKTILTRVNQYLHLQGWNQPSAYPIFYILPFIGGLNNPRF